jgi:hypothetical protein
LQNAIREVDKAVQSALAEADIGQMIDTGCFCRQAPTFRRLPSATFGDPEAAGAR